MERERYNKLMAEVLFKAGKQTEKVMRLNDEIEYELRPDGFLGFLEVYDAVRRFLPRDRTIIDFGCYYAAQSWLLDDYRAYIGVDTVGTDRFQPPNAIHYQMSIQQFTEEHWAEYHGAFAICSYVPDNVAVQMVREAFRDCLAYYPRIL